jgi:hypothetical protein
MCHVSEEKKNAYEVLVGKLEERRPLGRHRHVWRIILKLVLRKCPYFRKFLG